MKMVVKNIFTFPSTNKTLFVGEVEGINDFITESDWVILINDIPFKIIKVTNENLPKKTIRDNYRVLEVDEIFQENLLDTSFNKIELIKKNDNISPRSP
jgi:hypothetical protein